MKHNTRIACFICASTGLLMPLVSQAEVKSLSSSELTETYIKDSTIIVTPRINKKQTEQTTYSSLTIAPINNNDQDIEELHRSQEHNTGTEVSFALSDELLRNASVESVLSPRDTIDVPTHQEVNTVPIAELLGDPRYTVPEGDFDFTYIGNDLGLSRTDDQLTFSIGNLPGVNPIHLPEALNEGPLQIEPRLGGGFDLTINIPQDN